MTNAPWPVFAHAALRSPRRIGAVCPSSPQLAARLAAVIPRDGQPVVVEFGPGTGAVTAAISARLGRRGRQLAVESDAALLAHLRRHHPHVEAHHADAADLARLLRQEGVTRVDTVVSGLPWANFDHPAQSRILDQAAAALDPHGVFTTFAYLHALALPAAIHFHRLLEATFGEVLPTRTVWTNLPPAITYVCRHPRRPCPPPLAAQ